MTSLIFELRPAALDGQGFAPALEVYATEWSRQNKIRSELQLKGERPLPLNIERTLLRIVQEALANVARHSKAKNVTIDLLFHPDHLILTVIDDGQGFEPNSKLAGSTLPAYHLNSKSATFAG